MNESIESINGLIEHFKEKKLENRKICQTVRNFKSEKI